ncbi:MAG: D-alanyl-D-alanine carboxypeptidase/D-alanyl-D-alanine endopeptidase [Armatimonadota bacterium]
MMQRFTIILLTLCCMLSVMAAPPADLAATLNTRLADRTLKDATIGVFIQSLDTGDIWYERNANTPFIPASNAKIITAMLALEYLKPEYHFTTRLLTRGTRADGVLDGDLYLQGGGDPSLKSADLQTMARLLVAGDEERGIPPLKKVTGRLVLDASFFPGNKPLLGKGWEKGDLTWYYATPASALSCNRNAVKITVRGGKAGTKAAVTLDPPTGILTIINQAVTSSKVRTGSVDMSRSGSVVRITGRVAPGAELSEEVSVPDPARYTAEQLRAALKGLGVTIGEVAIGTSDPQNMQVLVEHNSAPLGELVAGMMKDSDNMYAEQFYWTLLALYSLEKPLDERYMALMGDFLNHSGLICWGMKLADGSGLSRLNKITPSTVARFLAYMVSTSNFEPFYQALPIAGEDGTLKKRMRETAAAGNARAKTGTMRSVSSLSGYVTTASGERLIFSIMCNGYRNSSTAARKLQDDIVVYLAGVQ